MAEPIAYRWRFVFANGGRSTWSTPSYNLESAAAMRRNPQVPTHRETTFEVEYLYAGPMPANGVAVDCQQTQCPRATDGDPA